MTRDTADDVRSRFFQIGRLIETGALEWNPSKVEEALQMIDQLKSEPRSHYYRAMAEYRLSLFQMRRDIRKFRSHVRKGLNAIKTSGKAGTWTSDELALVGILRDLRSTFSLSRRLEEARAMRAITAAKSLSPLNPRAFLAEGIFYFRRIGKSSRYDELSFQCLSHSCELYESEGGPGRTPVDGFVWGREEAEVWLALAMKLRGDRSGAFNKLREAVTRSDNYAWAKYELSVMTGSRQLSNGDEPG